MIYLIDDDKSVRRAFELFLKSAGLEYHSFENAIEFLSTFKPSFDDIIVLDLNLPGMKGSDLLKEFTRKRIVTPIIIVTALDDPQSRESCKRNSVKAYLRKPVDCETLLDIIKFNLPSKIHI
jgi:FixJ family two-component response regulator